MKKETIKEQKDVNKIRKEWESHYNDYFYQTFYQSFNIDGIDFQQEDFLKLKDFTVVAWQPLPHPYQPKGE